MSWNDRSRCRSQRGPTWERSLSLMGWYRIGKDQMLIPNSWLRLDVEGHSVVEVLGRVMKVMEHVVRDVGDAVLGRHADRGLVGLAQAQVVEGDS